MKSRIVKGTTESTKFTFVDLSSLTKDIAKNQYEGQDPMLFAMAKILVATTALASDLKDEGQKVMISVTGDEVISKITAEGNYKKEYIDLVGKTNIDDEKLKESCIALENNDISSASRLFNTGNGILRIVIDKNMKNNYETTLEVKNGNLDEAIRNYFLKSEQIRSIVSLQISYEGINIKTVCGYVIQMLPYTSNELFEKLKSKISRLRDMTDILENGYTLEKVVKLFYEDDLTIKEIKESDELPMIEEIKVMESKDVYNNCICSEEKFYKSLINVVSFDELADMIKKTGYVETVCEICGEKYKHSFKQ